MDWQVAYRKTNWYCVLSVEVIVGYVIDMVQLVYGVLCTT